jgi:hypothetical protein
MSNDNNKKSIRSRPPFQASAERQALVEALLDIDVGGELLYADIAKLISESPQSPRGQAIIQSAKRHLRDEHRRLFTTVRTRGLKRLNNEEGLDQAGVTLTVAVSRRVKVGTRQLQCVIAAELPAEKRVDYDLAGALARAFAGMLASDNLKLARVALQSQSEDPEIGRKILGLFSSSARQG